MASERDIRVGIVGAKAYTAGVLMRILARHPRARIAQLQARIEKPEPVALSFPDLRGRVEVPLEPVDMARMAAETDVVFLALPHMASQAYAPGLLEAGKVVLDLGADYRFRDPAVYELAYGETHSTPDLTRRAAYGSPELHREAIKRSKIVGVPGCYPTSILLPLAPFMRRSDVDRKSIIADSASGISGAGRTPSDVTHYVERNESMAAYKVASHRHTWEIEEQLSGQASEPVQLTFTPHYAPMDRGIHTTIYLNAGPALDEATARILVEDFYADAPFVRILPKGVFPNTKDVAHTNYCDISVTLDKRNGRLILCSVLDNLVKGASGQAVQCMNLIFEADETAGLE